MGRYSLDADPRPTPPTDHGKLLQRQYPLQTGLRRASRAAAVRAEGPSAERAERWLFAGYQTSDSLTPGRTAIDRVPLCPSVLGASRVDRTISGTRYRVKL